MTKRNLLYTIVMVMFAMPLSFLAQDIPALPDEPREFLHEFPKDIETIALKSFSEDMKKELAEIKMNDKELYFELLSEVYHFGMDWPRGDEKERVLMEHEKKISILEVETQVFAFKYRKAKDGATQRGIKSQLSRKLTQLFDLREKQRALEIESIQEELARLKESVEVRKKNKEMIINRRLMELTEGEDYLDWR